jgi:hypothetical protein
MPENERPMLQGLLPRRRYKKKTSNKVGKWSALLMSIQNEENHIEL